MLTAFVTMLVVLGAFLLQSSVFPAISLLDITPNLLLMVTVCFGFMRGRRFGMLVGFFCGLLIDFFFGPLLGLNALVYMYIGFFNGYFYKVFFDEEIKVPMLLVAVSDLVYGILYYGIQFAIRMRFAFPQYLMQVILPECIYTVVMTLFLYRLLHRIDKLLSDNELEGQQSPWL
ncbi:MAG: rod shape-determining protein MreD [Lachnospiraceae bacterium]|nr:rod shape-determining protein MreD [Lachnospiraceae bacterium]